MITILPRLAIVLILISSSLSLAQGLFDKKKKEYTITTFEAAIADFESPQILSLSKKTRPLYGVDFINVFDTFLSKDPANPDIYFYLAKAYIAKLPSRKSFKLLEDVLVTSAEYTELIDSAKQNILTSIRCSDRREMKYGSKNEAIDLYRCLLLEKALGRLIAGDISEYKQSLLEMRSYVPIPNEQLELAKEILYSCDSNAILFTGSTEQWGSTPDISPLVYYVHSIEKTRNDISLLHRPYLSDKEYFSICTTGVAGLFTPVKALPFTGNINDRLKDSTVETKALLKVLSALQVGGDSLIAEGFELPYQTRKKLRDIYNVHIRYIPDSIYTDNASWLSSGSSLDFQQNGARLVWGEKFTRQLFVIPSADEYTDFGFLFSHTKRFDGFVERIVPLNSGSKHRDRDEVLTYEDSLSYTSMVKPDTNRLLALINSAKYEKLFVGKGAGEYGEIVLFKILHDYLNQAYGDSLWADAQVLERIRALQTQLQPTQNNDLISDRIDLLAAFIRRKNTLPATKAKVLSDIEKYKPVLRNRCIHRATGRVDHDAEESYLDILYALGQCDEAEPFVADLITQEYRRSMEDGPDELFGIRLRSESERKYYNSKCGARYDVSVILSNTTDTLKPTRTSLTGKEAIFSLNDTIRITLLQKEPLVGDTILIKWYDAAKSRFVMQQSDVWKQDDLGNVTDDFFNDHQKHILISPKNRLPEGRYRADILINNRVLDEVKCVVIRD